MNVARENSHLSSGRSDETLLVASSLCIAVLVTLASVLGLLAPWPYRQETDNWMLQARGQDIGNLLAVVVLVGSAIRMRAGSSRAALLWTGSLLYFLYSYVVYAFAVHFGRLFIVYVAILGLVAFTLIAALSVRKQQLREVGGAERKFAAWVLIGTGVLFALLWLSELIPATVAGEPPASLVLAGLIVNPVHVIDLSVVLPGMIVTGALALRGNEEALALTLPALVFSVLMGSSILAAMVLMLATGDTSAIVPMAMVATVVGAAIAAAVGFATRGRATAGKPPTQD